MDYALVYQWNRPIPGREAQGLEVLADVQVFFGKLFADGKIAEPIMLDTIGDSMMIIRGEMSFMFDLLKDEEYHLLMNKALFCADKFEVQSYFTGELFDTTMGYYAKAGKELAYL